MCIIPAQSNSTKIFKDGRASFTSFNHVSFHFQDDSYLESYISTIGVDFVSDPFYFSCLTA